jgi:cytochrome c oxidase cbb3-type subunit 3
MKALVSALLLVILTSPVPAQQGRAPQPAARTNPLAGQTQAVDAGQKAFRETCSVCHGAFGEGGQGGEGQGPNLITSGRVQRSSDDELFGIIQHGVPGSAMPAFALAANKTWQLVSYLRTLSATAVTLNVAGNAEAGRAIFSGKGQCSDCHMIGGKGGFLGPDLSDIGATRRLDQLRDAVLKTTQGGSTSRDLYGDPLAGYRPILLTMQDGTKVEAVAKHYSNYSVQALDKAGNLHLLHGADIKRAEFLPKSWMPDDYSKRLSAVELQDLLAYLSRQSIRPPSGPNKQKVATVEEED